MRSHGGHDGDFMMQMIRQGTRKRTHHPLKLGGVVRRSIELRLKGIETRQE
jgi:hypothetical protein